MSNDNLHKKADEQTDEQKAKPEKQKYLTLKGQKMAESMAAFLMLRYFFPVDKNPRRINKAKEDFAKDMSFRLETG